jgi:hypothetical protein
MPRDDAVAVNRRFAIGERTGRDKSVDLDETPFIEEDIKTLAGGELALRVLSGEAMSASSLFGGIAGDRQPFQLLAHGRGL